MKIQVVVLCILRTCGDVVGHQSFGEPLHPEDGGNMVLRDLSILPHHYTEPQPTGSRSEGLCM